MWTGPMPETSKVYQVGIGQDVLRDVNGIPVCFEDRSEALTMVRILENEVLMGKRDSKRIHLVVLR
jgi:hypothetical protein